MFAEADMSMTTQAMAGMSPGQRNTSKLLARIFNKAIQDPAESKAQGRPIYREAPTSEIYTPGCKTGKICRPIREQDKHDFARIWEAFSQNGQEVLDGTPLVEWPPIGRGLVEELAYFNVRTVEQLAGLSDTHAQKFMGIQAIRQQAKDWLAAAKGDAPIVALREENETLKGQVADMQAQLSELINGQKTAKRAPARKAVNPLKE